MKQQHKIILEQADILALVRNITNKKDITVVSAIGSVDADMHPIFDITFTINEPTQPQAEVEEV